MRISLYNVSCTSDKRPSDYGANCFKLSQGCLVKSVLSFSGFVAFLVLLRYVCLPLLTYLHPDATSYLLDTGIYGAYPRQDYVSSDLIAPQANVVQSDKSCAGGLVFLDLGGHSVPQDGSMIISMSGNLVWSAPSQYGPATANTKIQRYQDEDFLTFWAGNKLQESGLGKYYMLDASYDLIHTVSAVGDGLEGDLHEFKVTEEGSALITIYQRVQAEVYSTNGGTSSSQMIVDGIFQEIDIETGKLLFEWRASKHLDHPALQKSDGGLVADGSLDYFHINSIDKDLQGNYLVSLRHLHTVVYIERETGEILWTFGTGASDFRDLSMGAASGFRWQHDARWISEDEGIISLFDNGNAHKHTDAPYSQGLFIRLDFIERTAELLENFTSHDPIRSPSQGNVQVLTQPEGSDHVFIGWGASAAFTEHALNGDLLCETHYGASWLFYFERVKSYRAFKTYDWKGIPAAWGPSARIKSDKVYVSWNGATEVAYWLLQRRQGTPGEELPNEEIFEDVDFIAKGSDFECSFSLPFTKSAVVYRIVALDANEEVLRFSNLILYEHTPDGLWVWLALFAGASLLSLCAAHYMRKRTPLMKLLRQSQGADVAPAEYHALQQRGMT